MGQPEGGSKPDSGAKVSGTTSAQLETRDARYGKFLELLAVNGNVTVSCRDSGVSRRNVYNWRETDADFRDAWDDAVEASVDLLEAECRRRAEEGETREFYYKGELSRTERTFSDTLAIFLLKGMRPQKYRHEAYVGAAASAMDNARALREADAAITETVPEPAQEVDEPAA